MPAKSGRLFFHRSPAMNPRRAILLAIVLVFGTSFGWLITWGNAVWRVHRHYPHAKVYLNPLNSPDPTLGDLIRPLGIDFCGRREFVRIAVTNDNQFFPGFSRG